MLINGVSFAASIHGRVEMFAGQFGGITIILDNQQVVSIADQTLKVHTRRITVERREI